jgi:hypothetical protein
VSRSHYLSRMHKVMRGVVRGLGRMHAMKGWSWCNKNSYMLQLQLHIKKQDCIRIFFRTRGSGNHIHLRQSFLCVLNFGTQSP